MFGKKNYVETEELKELKVTVTALIKEKRAMKEELEDLKLKKRLEAEEIAHMVKMNKEKNNSELERAKIDMIKENHTKFADYQEEQRKILVESLQKFHSKMEEKFDSELKNMKDVLALLMKGLPNVNMEITKHIGIDPSYKKRK